jgi:hypothetical protein
MNLKVAFTTSQRPYFANTLASYFDCVNIDPEPFIAEEPGTLGYPEMSRVNRVQHTTTLGVVDNWLFCLEQLSDAEWVVICQDDCVFHENTFSMLKMKIKHGDYDPELGFVSLYCSVYNWKKLRKQTGRWRLTRFEDAALCGALGVCIPKRNVNKILDAREKFKEPSTPIGRGLDNCLSTFFRGRENWIAVPSLLIHTGDVSTHPTRKKYVAHHHETRATFTG